jgi:acetyl-CoA carboxylase carboxyl transferase subunit beta
MNWFSRKITGITTSLKKETPEGLWYQCPSCKKATPADDQSMNLHVCTTCDYHERIGSQEYFSIIFDDNEFNEINADMLSADPLKFTDTKKYTERLEASKEKTQLKDALRSAHGKVNGEDLMIACMDFSFIGGSMGSVVGEKIARAIDYSIKNKIPFMIISKSGGARMMEAAFSLMQMAKTAAKLSLLAEAKIPYISMLTDPTTGGVTASYAMLGDLNIAEPNALIGFAGPRVIKETIKKDLPEGFQTSEFVLEHGFLDKIIHRKDLKESLGNILKLLNN